MRGKLLQDRGSGRQRTDRCSWVDGLGEETHVLRLYLS